MGVRGAQQAHVQQARHVRVQGVARCPSDDRRRIRRGIAAGLRADVPHPGQGVRDGAVSGAAAQVALHGPRQVLPLRRGQGTGRQHHPRGAEPALEALGVHERALQRVQGAPLCPAEALDGRDLVPLGPPGRQQAALHGLAIQQHRAGAAIPGVAALLDAEPAEVPQLRPQAPARRGIAGLGHAVHLQDHPSNSSCSSVASRRVMWRRQAGAPCTSSNHTSSGSAAR